MTDLLTKREIEDCCDLSQVRFILEFKADLYWDDQGDFVTDPNPNSIDLWSIMINVFIKFLNLEKILVQSR